MNSASGWQAIPRQYRILLGISGALAGGFYALQFVNQVTAPPDLSLREVEPGKRVTGVAPSALRIAEATKPKPMSPAQVAEPERPSAVAKSVVLPPVTQVIPPPPATTKAATPVTDAAAVSDAKLEEELARLSKSGLGSLVQNWMKERGASSWQELMQIASNRRTRAGYRYLALQGALEIGGRGAAPAIANLLNDVDPGIRCISLLGLGEMRDLSLVAQMEPLLHNRAMSVRDCALLALVRTEGFKGRRHLLATMNSTENYVRKTPLPIIKRAFDLLDAIDPGSANTDACNSFASRVSTAEYQKYSKRWSICATKASKP